MKLTRHEKANSSDDYWVAQSDDFPIAVQGATADAAASNLRTALAKYLSGPKDK
jgi:predicted RNase H-like HicB family nuclease